MFSEQMDGWEVKYTCSCILMVMQMFNEQIGWDGLYFIEGDAKYFALQWCLMNRWMGSEVDLLLCY